MDNLLKLIKTNTIKIYNIVLKLTESKQISKKYAGLFGLLKEYLKNNEIGYFVIDIQERMIKKLKKKMKNSDYINYYGAKLRNKEWMDKELYDELYKNKITL